MSCAFDALFLPCSNLLSSFRYHALTRSVLQDLKFWEEYLQDVIITIWWKIYINIVIEVHYRCLFRNMSQSHQNVSGSDVKTSTILKNPTGYGKSPRNRPNRRSLSGAPLTCLFETRFQHLKVFQKAQNENRGLNSLLVPNSGAIYRSSMPATPIATPSYYGQGARFTEQALEERIKLKLHQSPRRGFIHSVFDEPDLKEVSESKLDLTTSSPNMTTRLASDRLSEHHNTEIKILDGNVDQLSNEEDNKSANTLSNKLKATSSKGSNVSTEPPQNNSRRSHKLRKEPDR